MASNDFCTDSTIGVDLTATFLSASAASTVQLPFRTGQMVHANNNGKYIFCRADSTICTNMAVILGFGADSATLVTAAVPPIIRAIPLTTTNAAPGNVGGSNMVGFAQTSIDSARFGWIQLEGLGNVNVLISCNPKVPLFTTSTAGSLDDATVSAGYVLGIFALTSAGSASAPLCWFHDVHIVTSNPV
jgi:hypothetical protein